MAHIRMIALGAFLVLGGSLALSQGICVPDTLQVHVVRGSVMAHLNAGDQPFGGLLLRLFKKGRTKKSIAEAKTNTDGTFGFKAVKPGEYSLVVKHPKLTAFYVDLVVLPVNGTVDPEKIAIWLGADFLKPCSGSYVELKK